MKLVDLEQKVFIHIVDESKGGVTYEVQMSIAEVFEKFFGGNTPQIVEAIPVEWLRQFQSSMPNTAEVMGVSAVLKMCQQEQEAQDG